MKPAYKKAAVLGIAVLMTLGISTQVYAVYAVHDSKVYAQIAQQIKKATDQINELRKQYDLQLQNLQDLSQGIISPITDEIALVTSEYNGVKKSMNSIISGVDDAEIAFQQTFKDFTSLDPSTATYLDIKGRQESNRVKSEELNKEFVTLINMKQAELEKSNERIQTLMGEIANCKGAKELAQLENLLSAEQVYSQNITNEIQGLKLKQDAIGAQQKKLADDAEQASQEKLAADFGKVADQAKVNTGNRVTTITEGFDRKVEAIGWE